MWIQFRENFATYFSLYHMLLKSNWFDKQSLINSAPPSHLLKEQVAQEHVSVVHVSIAIFYNYDLPQYSEYL